MKPPTPRMFYDSITFLPLVVDQDAAGGRVKSWPTSGGVNLRASVQPARSDRRQPHQGATRSEVDAVCYLAADPGCKPDDRLVWHATSSYDRTFSARGPANPPAGQDALWSVDLIEVK